MHSHIFIVKRLCKSALQSADSKIVADSMQKSADSMQKLADSIQKSPYEYGPLGLYNVYSFN